MTKETRGMKKGCMIAIKKIRYEEMEVEGMSWGCWAAFPGAVIVHYLLKIADRCIRMADKILVARRIPARQLYVIVSMNMLESGQASGWRAHGRICDPLSRDLFIRSEPESRSTAQGPMAASIDQAAV